MDNLKALEVAIWAAKQKGTVAMMLMREAVSIRDELKRLRRGLTEQTSEIKELVDMIKQLGQENDRLKRETVKAE